jgi:arsenate reductase
LTVIYSGWQADTVCIDIYRWKRADDSQRPCRAQAGRPGIWRVSARRERAVNDVVLWRRLLAELLGSAFLAAVVVGSGIAAQRYSPGNTGLELLENAAATAAGLFAIILMVGPVSGGHFNPVVSFVDAAFGGLSWRDAAAYLPVQVAGCIGGAVLANLMFALPAVSISTKDRATPAHFLSEIVATLGLIVVIFALARSGRSRSAAAAVGAYIGAAYFFTSSTSFANPAIAVGRMFSDTFAGIAPASVPTFIAAEIVGGALAVLVIRMLYPRMSPAEAAEIIVPHHQDGSEPAARRTASDGAAIPLQRPGPAGGPATRQPR